MRTTLTLDDDVAAKLKEFMRRRGVSLKEAVNVLLRRGFTAREGVKDRPAPYRVEVFRSALRAGVDPLRLNQLVDELEVEDAAARMRR